MAEPIRIAVELGPKGKKCAAWALDWPGLERGGKNEEVAVEHLDAYLPRYAAVAKNAGLESGFDISAGFDIVERLRRLRLDRLLGHLVRILCPRRGAGDQGRSRA
ncbi:MAG: hypothetical protein WBV06_00015 [Acidimicrobiia bacterium]